MEDLFERNQASESKAKITLSQSFCPTIRAKITSLQSFCPANKGLDHKELEKTNWAGPFYLGKEKKKKE